jgi:hypothetical protein
MELGFTFERPTTARFRATLVLSVLLAGDLITLCFSHGFPTLLWQALTGGAILLVSAISAVWTRLDGC